MFKEAYNGVVVNGEQRIVIEVELTVKSRKRTMGILDELSGRYDSVLYRRSRRRFGRCGV